ncbi:Fis family transcriptional regulator [Ralstonia solanacearum]|nr:Fis family transcriptional regulator [Ralstonia solanacearum]
MSSLRDLLNGIQRHPFKLLTNAFTAFSVIQTIVRGVSLFVPGISISGPIPLFAVFLVSVAWGGRKVWKPSRIEVPVSNCGTVIEVLFGDLFEQDGIRAIAVNDFFDSELGKPVSDKSVHGIFLKKCFGGHPETFDKQVDAELANVASESVARSQGKTKRFPIGSTALITVNDDRYIALAFASTDPATCKASANVTMMWTALHNLWQRGRVEAGGYPINLPLVGSGLSGLGLPTRDLLNLIILSAITETKSREITPRVRIVLGRDRFDHLDLRDVKKHWSE